jgi:hypothetical protein
MVGYPAVFEPPNHENKNSIGATLDQCAHLMASSHREAVERTAAFLYRSGSKLK